MTISAMLPPIVTVIATSSNFDRGSSVWMSPRPAQVISLLARMQCAH
jgi:hypothetical protein